MTDTVSRYEEVKQRVSLREFAEAHLEHLPGGKLVCPCGSGTGPNRSAAFSITPDGERWRCFSCDKGGDVFDLAGYVYGTEDRAEQYRLVCEWAGLEAEGCGERRIKMAAPQTATATTEKRAVDYSAGREREREYIERCRANMTPACEGYAYLLARGFTADEIDRFGIGWDGMRRRVVLPWSTRPGEWYHIDRDVTGEHPHKYVKPKSAEVGPQPLHNPDALDYPCVFIVEGVLDALAVKAFEAPVMALAGTGYRDTVRAIVERGYGGVVIVMLDNDDAGRAAQKSMSDELREAGVTVIDAGPTWTGGQFKDAGEALALSRDELDTTLKAAMLTAETVKRDEDEARYAEAMKRLRAIDPAETVMGIYTLADHEEPTPTGLRGLDRALDGGLRRGVYVLGAISSLGKTTLTAQIADSIAEGGRGVLFVTIEQSAQEIVAKSLSRIMRQTVGGVAGTVSTRTLMSRAGRQGFGPDRAEAFDGACLYYADRIAPHLRILEGTRQPRVSDVAEVVRAMREHDGEPPVVFIDYLQLLAPDSDRLTEKQATDRNMMSLRQLARDERTTVFVISSLNRSSYSGSISLDSFKESGGIEYGADVLLGLQPYRMGEKLEGVAETKRRAEATGILRRMKSQPERPCEIVVLKQRSGAVPDEGVPVTFMPLCNLFTDGADESAGVPIV